MSGEEPGAIDPAVLGSANRTALTCPTTAGLASCGLDTTVHLPPPSMVCCSCRQKARPQLTLTSTQPSEADTNVADSGPV